MRIESATGAVGFTALASTESGIDWLAIAPISGSTPATITASVNIARLVPGQHSGVITVIPADGSKTITIPVTLRVTGSPILVREVLSSATYAPTPVSPGQLVTITGLGLGPATGVAMRPSAAGAFETQLAGVRVLFDGVPAPLLFVRDDQINAIVPYALHGRVNTRLQIEFGGSFSIPIELKVVDASPGIFTAGNLGRGQAASLNADSTPNSSVNPVQRGSVIVVYGTGEGQTDPPGTGWANHSDGSAPSVVTRHCEDRRAGGRSPVRRIRLDTCFGRVPSQYPDTRRHSARYPANRDPDRRHFEPAWRHHRSALKADLGTSRLSHRSAPKRSAGSRAGRRRIVKW